MAEPPATAAPTLQPVSQADLVGAIWQWVGGRESRPHPPTWCKTRKSTPSPSTKMARFLSRQTATPRAARTCFWQTNSPSPWGQPRSWRARRVRWATSSWLNLGQAVHAGTGFGNLVIGLADEAGEMYFNRTAAPDLAANLEPDLPGTDDRYPLAVDKPGGAAAGAWNWRW